MEDLGDSWKTRGKNMEVAEERISDPGDALAITRRQTRMLLAALFSGTIVLAGCVHWPDIATDCASYGVMEKHQPMGARVSVEPLFRDELDAQCAAVREAAARFNPEARISGCVIPQPDGTATVYYWAGDTCALNHELCHARHGSGHTERYLSDLEQGVPTPYCPENQLNVH